MGSPEKCAPNEKQNDRVGSDALKITPKFSASVPTRWEIFQKTSRRFRRARKNSEKHRVGSDAPEKTLKNIASVLTRRILRQKRPRRFRRDELSSKKGRVGANHCPKIFFCNRVRTIPLATQSTEWQARVIPKRDFRTLGWQAASLRARHACGSSKATAFHREADGARSDAPYLSGELL
jgi:hypothetical protein